MDREEKSIRVLIVDDEPPARRRLERLLSRDSQIEIIGNCANVTEALSVIQKQTAELIFLDILMPQRDGFTFLESLVVNDKPLIIFVTAYDQYAVRAFEACAFDYLLKPYDDERFNQVLQRAKEQTRLVRNQEMPSINKTTEPQHKALRKLVIKTSQKVFFLNTDEIDWIKAEGKYARLYVGRESHLWRGAISDLETHLDQERFIRIHRSTIVNIERVKELHPLFHGEYQVILHDGTELTLSRRYRSRLQEVVGSSL
ncbi:MAG TPA: LytTR family DNA-binding domain-containing protein [Blastocatellia bacterium]|nr:LytTR family DNA-binding domain-containing protein [Blastocatellia bacterium]